MRGLKIQVGHYHIIAGNGHHLALVSVPDHREGWFFFWFANKKGVFLRDLSADTPILSVFLEGYRLVAKRRFRGDVSSLQINPSQYDVLGKNGETQAFLWPYKRGRLIIKNYTKQWEVTIRMPEPQFILASYIAARRRQGKLRKLTGEGK